MDEDRAGGDDGNGNGDCNRGGGATGGDRDDVCGSGGGDGMPVCDALPGLIVNGVDRGDIGERGDINDDTDDDDDIVGGDWGTQYSPLGAGAGNGDDDDDDDDEVYVVERLGMTALDAIGWGNRVAFPGHPKLTAKYNGWFGRDRYTLTIGARSNDTPNICCSTSTNTLTTFAEYDGCVARPTRDPIRPRILPLY